MKFADHRCTRCGRVWLSHQTVRGSCPRCGGPLQPENGIPLTADGKTLEEEAEARRMMLGCALIYSVAAILVIIAFFLYF